MTRSVSESVALKMRGIIKKIDFSISLFEHKTQAIQLDETSRFSYVSDESRASLADINLLSGFDGLCAESPEKASENLARLSASRETGPKRTTSGGASMRARVIT